MQELLAREGDDVIVTRGSTLENAGNLKPKYLKFIFGLYAGTRLEQQELYGIMMDDVEGALWEMDTIDQFRVMALPIGLPYKVIAVDPSVAEQPKDECGIIVAGATGHKTRANRHTFIIEDRSIHGSPAEWAKEVVAAYNKWRCPVVVEVNQGGALVKNAIHAINEDIPVIEVHAYKGKAVRAEPVYLKYDQGKVHHLGHLGNLESQMTSWVPGETKKSPDRLDALVYAVTALVIEPNRSMTTTRTRGRANKNILPGVKRLGGGFRTKSGLILPGNGRR
jgi:phage terminase large subunit-like protein